MSILLTPPAKEVVFMKRFSSVAISKEKVSIVLVLASLAYVGFGRQRSDEEMNSTVPDYKAVAFENSSYRDYTFEELADAMGTQKALLPYYRCDGVKEKNIFMPPAFANAAGNSLRVKAQTTGKLYVYRSGVFTNDQGQRIKPRREDGFLNSVAKAFEKLESLPSGARLLRALEKAPYAITVNFGQNRFLATVPNGKPGGAIYMASAMMFFKTLRKADDPVPFHQIGAGGILNWNPALTGELIESDGRTRTPPAYVSLGHELFHAFDSVRGLLDRRFIDGAKYEFTETVEYRGVFFENSIRKESGLLYRKFYSAKEGADLLTDAGQPILIPNICLN
jgi:hypothetical protein